MLRGDDKEHYYRDFEDLYNLLDGEPEVIRKHPEELLEWEYFGATDLVNDRLARFYNLCDRASVWISVPQ